MGNHSVHLLPTSWWIVNWSCTAEVTYGLERLASYIQEVDLFTISNGLQELNTEKSSLQPEYEHSKYSFEVSDQDMLLETSKKFEKKAGRALELGLVLTLPMTMF